ncbi:MAG: DUF169 domain-containing protein [bacterium]|nr:DUF169 domain-containing protein [bacterium]
MLKKKKPVTASQVGDAFKKELAMKYSPVGFYYAGEKPDGALGFKKSGSGCIMPLILASAKGKTVAFDEESMGWACSAFHLGYKDWIFKGVEYFLSHSFLPVGSCERFVKTPALAKKYVESLRFPEKSNGAAVFKPLENFDKDESPEVVIFFADANRLAALVTLLYFGAPGESDRVVARFASSCGSAVTLPLQYARNKEKKAVWGHHDISARARLPRDLMTLTFPYALLAEMYPDIKKSFLKTDRWKNLV